jgi:hypothetical protein
MDCEDGACGVMAAHEGKEIEKIIKQEMINFR